MSANRLASLDLLVYSGSPKNYIHFWLGYLCDKEGPKWFKVHLHFASLYQSDQAIHRIKNLICITTAEYSHKNCTLKIVCTASSKRKMNLKKLNKFTWNIRQGNIILPETTKYSTKCWVLIGKYSQSKEEQNSSYGMRHKQHEKTQGARQMKYKGTLDMWDTRARKVRST